MNFYINGKLVRTSKTKNYKYAVVFNGTLDGVEKVNAVFACSETLPNASKTLNEWERRLSTEYAKTRYNGTLNIVELEAKEK